MDNDNSRFEMLLKNIEGQGGNTLCFDLGYTSSYHLGLMLKKRINLFSDLINGLELGSKPVLAMPFHMVVFKLGLDIVKLANYWGLSREYLYREATKPLLHIALRSAKNNPLLFKTNKDAENGQVILISSPEIVLDVFEKERPLWQLHDIYAWWAPTEGRAYVQNLSAVLTKKQKVAGPLMYMLIDSIKGMPIVPPGIETMDEIKRSRALKLDAVNLVLNQKKWTRANLMKRWKFSNRKHIHNILISAKTHPHVTDAILGLSNYIL
ncbi:hypothetical protein R6242_19520 [Iodobacter sp. CM08]|uniref:hypothetical protein n=1 Tax=Iodobacter sp. CM08 TaxID=3085902 RepID=UPI0029828E0C|nr:hypothetical protein [Iodobacter sp. CM08]MDW5418762.1 hypothetical protein [Iodobacter sp. CM08]